MKGGRESRRGRHGAERSRERGRDGAQLHKFINGKRCGNEIFVKARDYQIFFKNSSKYLMIFFKHLYMI